MWADLIRYIGEDIMLLCHPVHTNRFYKVWYTVLTNRDCLSWVIYPK